MSAGTTMPSGACNPVPESQGTKGGTPHKVTHMPVRKSTGKEVATTTS